MTTLIREIRSILLVEDSLADAEMTIDDYVSTPADNYKFTASQNAPKAEPAKAAPTMASQPSPQPHN